MRLADLLKFHDELPGLLMPEFTGRDYRRTPRRIGCLLLKTNGLGLMTIHLKRLADQCGMEVEQIGSPATLPEGCLSNGIATL